MPAPVAGDGPRSYGEVLAAKEKQSKAKLSAWEELMPFCRRDAASLPQPGAQLVECRGGKESDSGADAVRAARLFGLRMAAMTSKSGKPAREGCYQKRRRGQVDGLRAGAEGGTGNKKWYSCRQGGRRRKRCGTSDAVPASAGGS
ncbi:uncharacterized protein B0I36DRAFT_317885 [Microdochium trichocladiopsis]|uniref:Uncharacterized protein n=1 Tax=Microdochium trichocladiopsis TaxID=1682393 RepID=A0A9P9BT35_9PEZI|nr:uncharacterized protein B0I36DRAFT_317885 [Microdochium trichocladiopsis]KAH7035219.1 hypothetical protein B0I36DRAFT_317885 [Microdochium trichocladiopsis]